MRTTYPLTKSYEDRLTFTQQRRTRTTSLSLGLCKPEVKDVSTRLVVLPNEVYLGASPNSWRDNLRRGTSATSTLHGYRYTLKGGHGMIGVYGSGNPGDPNGCYVREDSEAPLCVYRGNVRAPLDETLSLLADDKARSNLLSKYLKVRKTFRGGNFIAEFRETVQMMKRPVKALEGGFKKFAAEVKKGRGIKGKRRYASMLSDAWLSWTLGWSPLFSDVHDAAEALARLSTSNRFDGKRITGVGMDETSICHNPGNYNAYILLNRVDRLSSMVKYVAMIKARPDKFLTFADSFGITPGDVIPAVWEAIPWSFLIDYFVNVNEVLDGMQWASGDVAWVNCGVKNDNEIVYSVAPGNLPSGLHTQITCTPLRLNTVYKSRFASGIPYPRFHFKIPGIRGDINIAALWASAWSSRPVGYDVRKGLKKPKGW
ncbi:TPA_asm: maturation protein [ssRNA phage SRR5467091_1]|uniref:Maturation protein n=1 Tax=ssRNA phage SRR5467091_1 TaxID=2786459 RepID=A0A8S5L1C0_9VIRU|nr:maturation protein [ssRNA phage SRR5467091_1]DAD50906.1 TPA_asm: maturation protein [ssRNA phage SRR5467091_1]